MLNLELRHLIPLDKNNEPDVSNVIIPIDYGGLDDFKSSPLLFIIQHLLKYIVLVSDTVNKDLDDAKVDFTNIIKKKEELNEALKLSMKQMKSQNKKLLIKCYKLDSMNDQKSKGLLEEISKLRNQVQLKDELIADYDTMKAELIGLRNYVYNLEEDEFKKLFKKILLVN